MVHDNGITSVPICLICFDENTEVEMEDGSIKMIKDISSKVEILEWIQKQLFVSALGKSLDTWYDELNSVLIEDY